MPLFALSLPAIGNLAVRVEEEFLTASECFYHGNGLSATHNWL